VTQRIILAGGGHAHLAVLADWARAPLPGTGRVLVTAARHTAYSGMLPGWMAGIYRAEELLIDLAPLAEQAGARLVLDRVAGLDADRRTLRLASGASMAFDILSLATGGEADLADLAPLGDRLLALRPVDRFMASWPALVSGMEQHRERALAVVGAGAAGVEIALAARAALPGGACTITLISAPDEFLKGHSQGVRRRVQAELERRGIALRLAHATGTGEGLLLSDGTMLSADHVIAATGSRAPGWLAQSGLACTPAGFVEVGADMRSTSHPAILAAGDIVERTDRVLPRSGVHAVKAGPVLAANIRALLAGRPLATYQPRHRTLYLLATGERRAIGSWGPLAYGGKAAWWLKDRIDRSFVASHRPGSRQGAPR
jgi:pyridine nucleotide-disulfide oxidoreductase family protein